MAFGPGKYDDLCTHIRTLTQARGVLLIVIDGGRGSGFGCQATADITLRLPELLEDVAAQIRQDGIGGAGRGDRP
jgi:hypothetical protein